MDEWRLKCEDLSTELESSQRECRNYSSELFRLRAAWDETVEQLDSVRRENKNLADEIKDLLDQLGEGGRSIHELDKQRRRLQVKKFYLKQNKPLDRMNTYTQIIFFYSNLARLEGFSYDSKNFTIS